VRDRAHCCSLPAGSAALCHWQQHSTKTTVETELETRELKIGAQDRSVSRTSSQAALPASPVSRPMVVHPAPCNSGAKACF